MEIKENKYRKFGDDDNDEDVAYGLKIITNKNG